MRDRFTRVLRGHIAIARAVFPDGIAGVADRQLSPARICGKPASTSITAPAMASAAICRCTKARRAFPSSATTALAPGMILSNEPGYYKTGAYGIRIENLVLVTAGPQVAGAEKELNAFETLTLAPIDRRLIQPSSMTAAEIAWLNAYHARVRDALTPLLDDQTRAWLDAATAPLSAGA